jgi:hypothetical protein
VIPADGIIGEYLATYDGKKDLRVEATMRTTTPLLEVEEGADEFLTDLEASPVDRDAWVKPGRDGQRFTFRSCADKPCRLRYRVLLRAAGKKIDELETASEEGEVIVSPPSAWLLTPPRDDEKAIVRFRVKTPEATKFATGVYRSPSAEGAWDINLSDLWTAPYTVFGPIRMRTTTPKGARVDVALGPGKMGLTDDDIVAWAEKCQRAIVGYYGKFPIKEALLIFIAGRGGMGEGKTLGGGGGAIFMRVGERATKESIANDWVLTHEMVHLTFPTLPRRTHWAEEGVATYVEPFARARVGTLSVEEAWKGVVEGVPQGLPEKGDEGADNTHTWGRTYWGGALFFLLADVEYRRQTHNQTGLEHALRGINDAGGNSAVRWSPEATFAAADKAVGVPVLLPLYQSWKDKPVTPDLPKLWKDLGIVYANGKLSFDDKAPDAAIRKAITTAN